MINTIVGTRAVGARAGAGAKLRYGSGSDQMIRLLAAPAPASAPQHCMLLLSLNDPTIVQLLFI
jgi:hypothetical protein